MDNNLPDLKANETAQEDLSSFDKLTQSYLLLKKKICGTNELIKQYNDKLKECERLKTDLDATTKETRKVTCNYNTTLAKVIKLELQNTEYKKNIASLTTKVNEHNVKAAADQQHIQQLICKIKDLEQNENNKIMQYDLEKSSLQVKVKELEQELKVVKKSYDTKIKKIEKKIPTENDKKPKLKEVGINTVLTNDVIQQKPKVSEKCIITDEAYNVKEDVYPVFCGKCEILLEPPPLEKICNIMTNSCPKLIERISSPKKVSPRLQVSPEINQPSTSHYKTENLMILPNASPSSLQNQNNHANVLSPHATVTPNRIDYCNNFVQTPNLMNPGTYYVGPMPMNPVPLANLNAVNQNNHSESISTVASSLSIISSLQKRIDTLETKIKKLNKKKLKQSDNYWQHHLSNACTYGMNNPMQFAFMELWKRMSDLCDNKEKERSDTPKRNSKKLNSCKVPRLKPKKRLQNTHTNSWQVESVSKKIEQGPSRRRPKKRKSRYSSLFGKADISSNNSEDLENLNSDSETNSDFDSADDKTDTNMEPKTSPRTKMSKPVLKSNNALKKPTCSIQCTDIDEAEVETIRNSVESNKSAGGETDSGILSDSVEYGKLMQLEADMDTCLDSTECENTTKIKSSIENRSCFVKSNKSVAKSKVPERPLIKTALHLTKLNKLTEADTQHCSKTLAQSNGSNEIMEDKRVTEVSQQDDVAQDKFCTSIATNSVRKRKINEIQEQKNCSSRGNLLKRLKNLRKNSKGVNNTCQNSSNHQNIENLDSEGFRGFQEEKNLDSNTTVTETEDYVPKKRPRIAHIPKITITDHTSSPNNSLQVRKCLVKSIENTEVESQTIPVMGENNPNKIADHIKTRKDDISFNESKETMSESQEENNDKTKQLEPAFVNETIPSAENSIENNSSETTVPDIKNLPSEPETKNSNTIAKPEVNDSVKEIMETEIEVNNQCEHMEEVHENNLSSVEKAENLIEQDECIKQQTNNENVCENSKEEVHYELDLYCSHNESDNSILNISSPKSDADACNRDTSQITQADISDSLLNAKGEHFIDVGESNLKERNTKQVKKNKKKYYNKKLKQKATYPVEKLKRYINENKSPRTYRSQCKKLLPVRLVTDKFIKKQLQRLVDSNWETSVHWDVIEKLKSVCSSRIIAKGIVEFLAEESEDQTLDKTYTPPAPLMTKTQQKIAALLVDLEERKPVVFHFVQAGIEYKLFRLNQVVTRSTVQSFARMYTILARIKKDREKVRIFCCDALYCLGLNAIIVLYTVFTCWPEVFPINETTNRLLPKCMAHIIMTQQAVDFPKLNALKNMISVFYKYPTGTLSKDLLNEFLTALQENSHTEVETAVVLLAKREGTVWTYKNIIRSALLPMIINNSLPSTYRAFWLLGNLMRVFPIEDKDNSVGEIVEQLCDLINSGEGSLEQNEGVVSALLSLSRHKFDEVVQNTLKWEPAAPLRDRTEEQFNGLFNQRSTDFWKVYLKRNKHLFKKHQENKT